MAKTLYHSELSKLGLITARVLSEVNPSKFQGKPPYVILEIGDEERIYSTENQQCSKALSGLKGRMIELEAKGSREQATIRVETLDGAQESTLPARDSWPDALTTTGAHPSSARKNEQARPETYAEQQAREAKTFVEATRYSAKAGVLFSICYTHARLIYRAEDFPNLSEYELEDLRMRVAQFLAIESKSHVRIDALSAKWPETLVEGQSAGANASDEDWPQVEEPQT